MRISFLAALTSVVLSATANAAAPPSPSPEAVAIRRLVEELGDRDWRARELAGLRLREIPALALPHVRRALGHPDAEVRRRALRLLGALEDAVLFAPRRVTL